MITFIYNGTKIETPNLEKKLKRMKITMDDITIVEKEDKVEEIKEESTDTITLYTFSNGRSKIVSINNICPLGYEFIKEEKFEM